MFVSSGITIVYGLSFAFYSPTTVKNGFPVASLAMANY